MVGLAFGSIRMEPVFMVLGQSAATAAVQAIDASVAVQAECDNLLVTFCVSASHMGFASIRMEPVFMILSESAGLAAMEAVHGDIAVQEVSYERLLPNLIDRRQILKLEDVPEKEK